MLWQNISRMRGSSPKRPAALSLSVLSRLEGAFLFCHAARDLAPMAVAGATATAAVRTARAL